MHYLYLKTHSVTGLKYLGQTERDPFKYRGSGVDWKLHLAEHGKNHITEIICQSDDKSVIDNEGRRLSEKWNIVESAEWANRIPESGGGFGPKGRNKGTTPVIDKAGNKFRVAVDDPRFISGELVAHTKGKVTVVDKAGNKFRVAVDDIRIKTGELVNATAGTTTVKDKNGNVMQVSVDDPRLASGELVGIRAGIKEVITCPHCNKTGGLSIMKRWHMDRCKKKTT